jgi:hypothetical protein
MVAVRVALFNSPVHLQPAFGDLLDSLLNKRVAPPAFRFLSSSFFVPHHRF